MTDDERNRIAGKALDRLAALLERAGPVGRGEPLSLVIAAEVKAVMVQARAEMGPLAPDAAAEVELIFAEMRVLGMLAEGPQAPCQHGDSGCTYGSGPCDCAR